MILKTEIWKESEDSTVSKLFEVLPDGTKKKICYILEDGWRPVKIPKITRIPGGEYRVTPRQAGRHYKKYRDRWRHEFTMWVRDVPEFSWIMIHIGNYIKDTDGCLLTGTGFYWNHERGGYVISQSTKAYFKLYHKFGEAVKRGEEVTLIVDRSG